MFDDIRSFRLLYKAGAPKDLQVNFIRKSLKVYFLYTLLFAVYSPLILLMLVMHGLGQLAVWLNDFVCAFNDWNGVREWYRVRENQQDEARRLAKNWYSIHKGTLR